MLFLPTHEVGYSNPIRILQIKPFSDFAEFTNNRDEYLGMPTTFQIFWVSFTFEKSVLITKAFYNNYLCHLGGQLTVQ